MNARDIERLKFVQLWWKQRGSVCECLMVFSEYRTLMALNGWKAVMMVIDEVWVVALTSKGLRVTT